MVCRQADGRMSNRYSPHVQQIGTRRHRLVLLALCQRPWAQGLKMRMTSNLLFARRRHSSKRAYSPQKSWDQQGNRCTVREFIQSAAPAKRGDLHAKSLTLDRLLQTLTILLEVCRLVSETASGRGAGELRDSEEKGRRAEIASGSLVTQQEKGEASRQ